MRNIPLLEVNGEFQGLVRGFQWVNSAGPELLGRGLVRVLKETCFI